MADPLGAVLSSVGLRQWQQALQGLGVTSVADLAYVGDSDLMCLGFTVVEVRKLRSCTSSMGFQFQGLPVHWVQFQTNQPTYYAQNWQPAATIQHERPDVVEVFSDLNSVAAEIELKAQNALTAAARCAGPRQALDSLQYAVLCLKSSDASPRNAVLALNATNRALASCQRGPLYAAIDAAENAVRDTITLRVQVRVPMGNRDRYVAMLEDAYGGPISKDEFSHLMHSHSLTVCEKFPGAFLSKSKQETRRRHRGPRQRRSRASGYEGSAEQAEDNVEQVFNPVSRSSIGVPPGLEIVDCSSEVSFATGGKHHAWKEVVGRQVIIHPSGARTVCTSEGVLELDHADPDDDEDISLPEGEDRRVLVLSELGTFLWLAKSSPQWFAPDAENLMVNGAPLHVRPGTDILLSALLEEASVSFAIVSCCGSWCLPAMRHLLEHAMPGTSWIVEETFEGDWTSYTNGVTYTISGGDLWQDHWRPDADYWAYNERYAQFEVYKNKQCSMSRPGRQTEYGRLTQDGLLVWGQGDHEWTWFRAGKMTPPCLVCRERDLRVHIFDRDSVVEQMEKERDQEVCPSEQKVENAGESEWVWFRKELHRVWSELGEAKCGTFGVHNTLLLDEFPEACSHPDNVIALPRWSWHEDGSGMASLCTYVRSLIAAQPDSVTDYLRAHPFESQAFSQDTTTDEVQPQHVV